MKYLNICCYSKPRGKIGFKKTICNFKLINIFFFRDVKKQIEKSAPKRDSISRESKFDKARRLKHDDMVKASKKRKQRDEEGEKDGDGKKIYKKKKLDTISGQNPDEKRRKKKNGDEKTKINNKAKANSSDKENLKSKKKKKLKL